MPHFIILGNFTEQGVRTAKDTTKRAEKFKEMAKQYGATVKEVYWTLGKYDVVSIVEAPDVTSMTALGLAMGMVGNIRTQTLPAFSVDDMNKVLAKVK